MASVVLVALTGRSAVKVGATVSTNIVIKVELAPLPAGSIAWTWNLWVPLPRAELLNRTLVLLLTRLLDPFREPSTHRETLMADRATLSVTLTEISGVASVVLVALTGKSAVKVGATVSTKNVINVELAPLPAVSIASIWARWVPLARAVVLNRTLVLLFTILLAFLEPSSHNVAFIIVLELSVTLAEISGVASVVLVAFAGKSAVIIGKFVSTVKFTDITDETLDIEAFALKVMITIYEPVVRSEKLKNVELARSAAFVPFTITPSIEEL